MQAPMHADFPQSIHRLVGALRLSAVVPTQHLSTGMQCISKPGVVAVQARVRVIAWCRGLVVWDRVRVRLIGWCRVAGSGHALGASVLRALGVRSDEEFVQLVHPSIVAFLSLQADIRACVWTKQRS